MIDRKKYIEWMADTYMLNLPKLNLIGDNLDPIEDEALRKCVRNSFIAGAFLNINWPLEDEERIIELMNKFPNGIKKEENGEGL